MRRRYIFICRFSCNHVLDNPHIDNAALNTHSYTKLAVLQPFQTYESRDQQTKTLYRTIHTFINDTEGMI